jgi:hypothetical protein
MEEKDILLLEIVSLIEADEKDGTLDLNIMRYMSVKELICIRDNLKNRKKNREKEQEEWYNEWAIKCGI